MSHRRSVEHLSTHHGIAIGQARSMQPIQGNGVSVQRSALGGHHVDDNIIRRRYKAGIKNLFHLYCPVVDYFLFIDNSIMPSEIIAEGNIKSIKFYNEEKFKKIRQYDNSNSECQEE